MASWANPKLANQIANDIPDIQAALIALTKLDPSTITAGLPNGARRIASVSGGNQLQSYNGTSWASIGKLIHDVDQLDGYHANTGTTKQTIPVRDANGALPGNITGNAATASKASAISFTVGIAQGGTGKTTAADARTALGVPPTSHAVNANTYGLGTASVYGHVKLKDTYTDGEAATSGVALTPKALKDAVSALTGTVGGYLPLTGGTLTGNLTIGSTSATKTLNVTGATTLKATTVNGANFAVTADANLNKENGVSIFPPMNLSNVWLNHVNIGFRTFLVDPNTKNSYVTQRMDNMYPFKILNHVDNSDHGAKGGCGFAINSPNALVLLAGDTLANLVNGYAINGETNILGDSWTERLVLAADNDIGIVTNANTWANRRISMITANGQLVLGGSGCGATTAPTAAAGRTMISPRNINAEIVRSTLQGYIYGDAPTATQYTELACVYSTSGKNAAGAQVNETRIGTLEVACSTNGVNSMAMVVRNKANSGWCALCINSNNEATGPNPVAASNGGYLATTAWIRDRCTNRINGTKNEAVTQTANNQTINQTLAYNSTDNKIVISNNYDNTLVHRAGTETISGAKTFTANMLVQRDSPSFTFKCTDIERNVAPSANKGRAIWFLDKNGKRLSYIYSEYRTTKQNFIQLACNKSTTVDNTAIAVEVGYDKDGNWYTSVPQPANEDKTNKIANTAWVHTAISGYLGGTWGPKTKYATEKFASDGITNLGNTCVKLTGNQSVAGNKTFSGTTTIGGNLFTTDVLCLKVNPYLICRNSDLTKGTNPSANKEGGLACGDKNGTGGKQMQGRFASGVTTAGLTWSEIRAYNWTADATNSACIRIYFPKGGTAYTEAPTPADNDNTTKLATTAWVQKFCGTTKKYLTSHQSLSGYVKTDSKAYMYTGNLEIYSSWPYIDFHHNNSGQDFTARIESTAEGTTGKNAQGTLRISAKVIRLGNDETGASTHSVEPAGEYRLGNTNAKWGCLYASNGTIQTSDERLKQDIKAIPSAVLDVWGDIQLCQFHMRDSVKEKGSSARLHTGIIAQQAQRNLSAKGIEASQYGFFCYDEWEDQYEDRVVKIPAVYDEKGNLIREAGVRTERVLHKAKGNEYSVRYEEFLIIEAAYHRRQVARLEQRIADLERRLNAA